MLLKLACSCSVVAAFVVACGSASQPSAAVPDAHDGSVDGSVDASADAATVAYETVGPYRCCAEGTGLGCCEGTRQGTCFKYGGIYDACRAAGETYEGKVICARCCDGLERADTLVPGNQDPPEADHLPEGCDFGKDLGSTKVCIRCGDGTCGPGENFCNCPADCPR